MLRLVVSEREEHTVPPDNDCRRSKMSRCDFTARAYNSIFLAKEKIEEANFSERKNAEVKELLLEALAQIESGQEWGDLQYRELEYYAKDLADSGYNSENQ